MALPYIEPPRPIAGVVQFYALSLIGALAVGFVTVRYLAKRSKLPDVLALSFAMMGVAWLGAHLFDVAFYQWDYARRDPTLWLELSRGISLFGAMIASAVLLIAWTSATKRDLARHADVFAVGWLAAMTIGRVGCALVHDHPGVPTDSPIGVDFPVNTARWALTGSDSWHLYTPADVIRMHDCGLEELLMMIPLTIVGFVMIHRQMRAGLVAAIVALVYAGARFSLDFLRSAVSDPRNVGLTPSQWCCIALAIVAAVGLSRTRTRVEPDDRLVTP
jgi:phosphatidylglycerol:prolipoprotein diacylglycerol transferase